MIIRKRILFLLFLLYHVDTLSQNLSPTDSLIQTLKFQISDTSRVLNLEQIAKALMYSKPDEALTYANQGLELANKISFLKGQSRCLNRLGVIQTFFTNYEKALENLLTAVKISESINDQEGLARAYINIGVLYNEQNDTQQAKENYLKAKVFTDKIKNDVLLKLIYLNLGSNFSKSGQIDSAIFYSEKALQMSLKLNNDGTNIILLNLGDLYQYKKDYTTAMDYYYRSIGYSKQFQANRILGQSYYNMARVFQSQNQIDSSLYYAHLSFKICQETSNLSQKSLAGILLSELYQVNDPAKALVYYKNAMATKDSVFNDEKIRQVQNLTLKEKMLSKELDYAKKEFENKQKIGILLTILIVFLLILAYQYNLNRHKNKTNRVLNEQKEEILNQKTELQTSLTQLKSTQNQLIQKEKLASLGELTAGIAHEIQNPLNFVNNFSELSTELVEDLKIEIDKTPIDKEFVEELMGDLIQNQQKINLHGKRASSIVANMLQHSRASTGERTSVNVNKLLDDYVRLSYHGIKAKDTNFQSDFQMDFDEKLPLINAVGQDLGRVFLNLLNNAFYATNKRRLESKEKNIEYKPSVKAKTKLIDSKVKLVEISIEDNGTGMNEAVKEKIFQPFFTTKPTGEGTGLGLSLCHDIITKGNDGTIEVESEEGVGTKFIIRLPIS